VVEGRLRRALVLAAAVAAPATCVPEGLEPAVESSAGQPAGEWATARATMVATQLRARDIVDERVLRAMAVVPRHLFVPEQIRASAYEDRPLPIGFGQTISQPYIVAYMTQALRVEAGMRVLEIGTGSGYQAAVLAELGADVYSMEIVEPLATRARQTLAAAGYGNVKVRYGNGYLGWPEQAPFARIIVTAAPEAVPPALVAQLATTGLLVAPVGTPTQVLTIVEKTPAGLTERRTLPVRFVPMVGKPGGTSPAGRR
jgi:protein-L-isoaspartate(D-aspartate) O-methyltransferase